jgi:prolipoprotein diacylglyceryl transferase
VASYPAILAGIDPAALVAAIPSPSSNQFSVGPLTLNFYGLSIGMGALLGTLWARQRWAARGGDPDQVTTLVFWGLPAGIIGARMYHNITDGRAIADWYKVWEGGLGIPGGLLVGIAVGIWQMRRQGMDVAQALDAVVPAIPVAQAFGRLGNWFNQELFGRPTDLPWGLEIDPAFRPPQFADQPTFHPAFLYEGLWNLMLAAVLVRIDRTGRLAKGMILPLYVAGYGLGRFLVESVRIDTATEVLGIRVNHWMSAMAVLGGLAAARWVYANAGPSFYRRD